MPTSKSSRPDGRHAFPAQPACHCGRFERMSSWASRAAGCRRGFRLAVLLLLGWAAAGPLVRFHESWTTTFSVATTTITFLMLFLVQAAQSRETKAIHLKLDELLYAAKNARNELIHIEHLTEEQLDLIGERYSDLAGQHRGPG